jgi:hypothetical protein
MVTTSHIGLHQVVDTELFSRLWIFYVDQLFKHWAESIVLLEGSQASPTRPSDKNKWRGRFL